MLENVMQRLGQLIAADQGLKVSVRGDKAYAMPGEIVIPNLETYESLGREAERMLHGLLDHECGHALDTDFNAYDSFVKTSELARAIGNTMEDGYIERRQGLRYVGCKENLARKNTWFWEEAISGVPCGKERVQQDDFDAFLLALTMVVRPWGGRTIEEIKELAPKVGTLLEKIRPEIEALPALADKPKNSKAVVALAKAILAKLKDEAEKRKTSKKPDEGTPQKGRGKGKKGDKGEKAGAAEPTAASMSEGDDGEPAQGGDGEDTVEVDASELAASSAEWKESKPTNPEKAIMTEIRYQLENQPQYAVYSHEWDAEVTVPASDRLREEYEALERETVFAANALVSCFEAALRAKRAKRLVSGFDEGMIDVPSLAAYATGAQHPDSIFCEMVAEDDREVAVAILVDCSGSMSQGRREPKATTAAKTAIAMHTALTRVGIQHEITGFTTFGSGVGPISRWLDSASANEISDKQSDWRGFLDSTRKRPEEGELFRYGRYWAPPPVYPVFKSFDSVDPYGLASIIGTEENLDGEAVLWQARRLAKRKEPRRVLFVLSDGYPAGSDNANQGAVFLKESVMRVIESGIEVYGIGIQSDSVRNFYPTHWVCDDLDGLTEVAFGAMTQALIDGRRE